VTVPKDGDSRRSFAVLDAADDAFSATIQRVSYDAAAVAVRMRAVGLPDELAEQLPLAA
jgi:hypothetical protein